MERKDKNREVSRRESLPRAVKSVQFQEVVKNKKNPKDKESKVEAASHKSSSRTTRSAGKIKIKLM